MNDWAAPPSADRLPTLTEVVDLAEAPPTAPGSETAESSDAFDSAQPVVAPEPWAAAEAAVSVDAHASPAADSGAAPIDAGDAAPTVELLPADVPLPPAASTEPAPPAIDPQAVVALALAELQPRLDMLLESRLRAALAPALARAAEGLIDEARGSLGTVLHELVQDAVQRALQRQAARTTGVETPPPHRP